MKVTDIKSMKEYDEYCRNMLNEKIPVIEAKDWRLKVGDCIYNYSKGTEPLMRIGVHNEENRKRDLSENNALLSNHFYYFGSEARPLPSDLKCLIKKNRGHKKIGDPTLIEKFEEWIKPFEKNKIYADSQMRWFFDRDVTEKELSVCAKRCIKEEDDDDDEK